MVTDVGTAAAGGETGAAATGEKAADTGAAAAADTTGASAGVGTESAPSGEAEAKAYTPNFKYKVLKEEKEIPEWARPMVKDQVTEKQARDLFAKADGLTSVTTHRDQLIQQNKQMQEQWGPFVADAQAALESARKGDLDTFFEKVGIPEVAILKYALHRLQLREKPEALAAHENERRLSQEMETLRQENQRLQSGFAETSVQTRTRDLEMQLGRPEILPAAQAFDVRVGKPGAFRAEVIKRGQLYAAQGQDISAEQAAAEVLQLIGWSGQTAAPSPGAATMGGAGGESLEPKPVLPNIRGKGTAPVRKLPRSTDELRQLGRNLRGF